MPMARTGHCKRKIAAWLQNRAPKSMREAAFGARMLWQRVPTNDKPSRFNGSRLRLAGNR